MTAGAHTETGRGVAVDVQSVSHAYSIEGAPLPVLDNISLRVEPGEFVSCLGPSGCGKSTLLRLLAGLETPSRGPLLSGSARITGPHPSRILAFQDATLFPWATVWQNVAAGPTARNELRGSRQRIDEAIAQVGLSGFERAYPHQLSGGMAQRAALARALVNDPSVLLLDEPFGKLDSFTRMALQDDLRALWEEKRFTGILVTHDVEEAILLSERVLVFSDRPARLLREFRIDLGNDRERTSRKVVKLRGEILSALNLGHRGKKREAA